MCVWVEGGENTILKSWKLILIIKYAIHRTKTTPSWARSGSAPLVCAPWSRRTEGQLWTGWPQGGRRACGPVGKSSSGSTSLVLQLCGWCVALETGCWQGLGRGESSPCGCPLWPCFSFLISPVRDWGGHSLSWRLSRGQCNSRAPALALPGDPPTTLLLVAAVLSSGEVPGLCASAFPWNFSK